MVDSLKIKKLVLALAVCTAAGSVVGAVISGDAHAQAQIVNTEKASQTSPQPASSEKPFATVKPADEIKGVVNILLIGTDEVCTTYDDQGRGDVTLLCSVNADSKTVKLISFERSTGVSWPGHGDIMLTSTYAYGGAELTAESICRSFDISLDGYVHVDFEGFSRIIDAMGGIDIYLTEDEADPESSNDFGKNVIPAMLGDGVKLVAYPFKGYWKDVGTIRSLWEANMDLLGEAPAFDIHDWSWRIFSRTTACPPQVVGVNGKIKNSLISDGCEVYGTVENSVLSNGVIVEEGAVIRDSVIMSNVTVKSGAVINYSMLDSSTTVGRNAVIGRPMDDGIEITVVPADTSVNDGEDIHAADARS